MFARRVAVHLKPNSVPQFIDRIENEILPVLRRQKGFQDEVTFVTPSGSEAFVVSLWDQQESAEAYSRAAYADVVKVLATVIEGSAQVEIFNVVSSTIHKIAATARVRPATA